MKKNEKLYITNNLQIQKSAMHSYYLNGAIKTILWVGMQVFFELICC
jgi:hypothetical protein